MKWKQVEGYFCPQFLLESWFRLPWFRFEIQVVSTDLNTLIATRCQLGFVPVLPFHLHSFSFPRCLPLDVFMTAIRSLAVFTLLRQTNRATLLRLSVTLPLHHSHLGVLSPTGCCQGCTQIKPHQRHAPRHYSFPHNCTTASYLPFFMPRHTHTSLWLSTGL